MVFLYKTFIQSIRIFILTLPIKASIIDSKLGHSSIRGQLPMKKFSILFACLVVTVLSLACAVSLQAADDALTIQITSTKAPQNCELCHSTGTAGIVNQFHNSAMFTNGGVTCVDCHGDHHADKTSAPTVDTCAKCHQDKVDDYMAGKHSKAWDAMINCPVSTVSSDVLTGLANGMKGCNQCHTVGVIPNDQIAAKGITSDVNPCDTCHVRHQFSAEQAKDPETCAQCHIGFDHPQYEMWTDSAMGTAWKAGVGGPSCQDCHMVDGTHNNITAWGFLGLRYPESDEAWLADRVEILKSIGVFANGDFTDRLNGYVAKYDVARLTEESFNTLYAQEKKNCQRCHSASYVETQFKAAETVLKQADDMMAEAIDIVIKLHEDGLIVNNEGWTYNPDLLYFFESDSTVDDELFKMFLSYRNRAFQSAFHMNADYTYWYGISAMGESLNKIKEIDANLRADKGTGTPVFTYIALAVAIIALTVAAFALLKKKA